MPSTVNCAALPFIMDSEKNLEIFKPILSHFLRITELQMTFTCSVNILYLYLYHLPWIVWKKAELKFYSFTTITPPILGQHTRTSLHTHISAHAPTDRKWAVDTVVPFGYRTISHFLSAARAFFSGKRMCTSPFTLTLWKLNDLQIWKASQDK